MYTSLRELVDWEEGMLSEKEEIMLFSKLVKSGMAWNLQGTYGRNAYAMIQSGLISKEGDVLVKLDEFYE